MDESRRQLEQNAGCSVVGYLLVRKVPGNDDI